jgi:hypothetical protein
VSAPSVPRARHSPKWFPLFFDGNQNGHSPQRASLAFRSSAIARLGAPVVFANGATPPPNARFPLGAKANSTLAKSFSAAPSLPLTSIDHHTAPRLSGWKVRDQGQRGTCVAHALAACTEVLAFQSVPPVPTFDGSEQFLFWGAKQLLISLGGIQQAARWRICYRSWQRNSAVRGLVPGASCNRRTRIRGPGPAHERQLECWRADGIRPRAGPTAQLRCDRRPRRVHCGI